MSIIHSHSISHYQDHGTLVPACQWYQNKPKGGAVDCRDHKVTCPKCLKLIARREYIRTVRA